jgi:tRNA G18 (ribose-2'-O)-methylase SpoU
MARNQIFFGRQVLKEALLQKIQITEVFCQHAGDEKFIQESFRSAKLKLPSIQKRLPSEAPQQHAQGVAFSTPHSFYLSALPPDWNEVYPRVLLLNHLQDVQNLGAISRSAAAFGFQLVVHESRRSCKLSPIAVRISQGQAFRLKYWEVSNLSPFLDKLEERDYETVGLDSHQATPLFDWQPSKRIALLLGAEEGGIQRSLRDRLQQCFQIPMMAGVESLNVSQAASIAMAWSYSSSKSSRSE